MAGPKAGVRWGILGPGQIAGNFADGLRQSRTGCLVALWGHDPMRASAFAARFGITAAGVHDRIETLLSDPGVDAVYIATPHPLHRDLALAALRAGKPVLVEKPMCVRLADVTALVAEARSRDVFLMEAYMYRCHPQIARAAELVRQGVIGTVTHITARFGFSAPFDPASRLYAPDLAGGGILDVGGYPVSAVRLFAGAAAGLPFADPLTFRGTGLTAPTGVDAVAFASMTFGGNVTAEISCAIMRDMENAVVIDGTAGRITLPDPWVPGRDAGPCDAVIRVESGGSTREEWLRDPRQLFAWEADVAGQAILDGRTEAPWPAMGLDDSLGNAAVLERWRNEVARPDAPV